MSPFFIALFFAAGIGGFAYSRLGRRVGYGNTQNVWVIVAVSFVIAFIFLYTLLRFVIY